MALPATIRVKISSEIAESISITPVLVREMPVAELVETMLGIAGKDRERLRDLLRRGSLVAGSSRFRWQGWEAAAADLDVLLAAFPDPDPSRAFASASCTRAVLRGTHARIEIPRDAASEHRLFRKRTYWHLLMEVADAGAPRYVGYSYKERADYYELDLAAPILLRLREGASALRYSTLEAQIRSAPVDRLELYVPRP